MARPRKKTALDAHITGIIASAAAAIAQAVRDNIAGQLKQVVSGARKVGRPAGSGSGSGSASAAPRSSGGKRNYPAHCIFPGCVKAHGGPRSGFFCETHIKISKAEKDKIKAARKGGGGKARRGRPPGSSKKK